MMMFLQILINHDVFGLLPIELFATSILPLHAVAVLLHRPCCFDWGGSVGAPSPVCFFFLPDRLQFSRRKRANSEEHVENFNVSKKNNSLIFPFTTTYTKQREVGSFVPFIQLFF